MLQIKKHDGCVSVAINNTSKTIKNYDGMIEVFLKLYKLHEDIISMTKKDVTIDKCICMVVWSG